MTFKKAEMAKNPENGLNMIETNPLNHNWSHFVILSGLPLHQFKKKLLLSMQARRNIQGHGDLFRLGHVSKGADYAHQLNLSPLCLESFRRTLIPFLSGFPLVLSSNLWCILHNCDH